MRARTAAAVSALAACASACNLLVGGDDLVFRDGGSGGGGGTTSGPGSGGGGGVGGGSSSVVGGGGSGEGGAPPSLVPVESIAAGRGTCAVLEGGRVRCWGRNDKGQLGLGHTDPVSIDAPPSADVTLPPGVVVEKVVVGLEHACALSSTQEVYCWGSGANGRLGHGNTEDIGATNDVGAVGPVPIGDDVLQLVAGSEHTCAILGMGNVRCWGRGSEGQLGYGSDQDVHQPTDDVSLGGNASFITAGGAHTCVGTPDGSIICWGAGTSGQLGYGTINGIGATPWTPMPVPGADDAVDLEAGGAHTCVRFNDDAVRCWGQALADGYVEAYGDNEPASDSDILSLPWPVGSLSAGAAHTCALANTNDVRCWGLGADGRLGYGDTMSHVAAFNEVVAISGPDNPVTQIAAGERHTCARLLNGAVRCWGFGGDGRLGYGNENGLLAPMNDVPLQ